MLCGCDRSLHAALLESDHLLGQRRFTEALALATRALGSRPHDPDLRARFRLVRAHALWMTGRVLVAAGEAQRVAAETDEPLTRARAHDAMALFAWKGARFELALLLAESSRRVYESRAVKLGLARSLQAEAGLWADRGELEPALRAQTLRVEALGRAEADRRADALADRGSLLALLGRWGEARADLDAAGRLFRNGGRPGGLSLKYASLELFRGDLGAARRLLDEARAAERMRPSGPRALAEACLVGSDVLLACGLPDEADAEARTAVRLFVETADRGGECRARVRRAQALLSLGRVPESIRESKRALADGERTGKGIEALAELTLGRALLRSRPEAAQRAFERAAIAARGRPDLTHAARLGRALAAPGASSLSEIDEALGGLEKWGDVRLTSLARADVQKLSGGRPEAVQIPVLIPQESDAARALVRAAIVLKGDGEWIDRLGSALEAVRPFAGFERCALVSREGPSVEARPGWPRPKPLPADDHARDLVSRALGPALFELTGRAPAAIPMPGSHVAAVVPLRAEVWLYADRRTAAGEGALDLGFLTELGRLLAAHLPEGSNEDPPPIIPGLVGRSGPMQALAADIVTVAATEGAIHIFGETGTGKERVAKAIHDRSVRAGRPFVAVNVASLSDELFDSQVFGHAKGAFSGAIAESEGLVVAAEGGTLFLDEVADLSASGQARLLRFLQEREYRRLGETRLRHANVRILSAANVRLAERVAKGRFREDLYYRLVVYTVLVPPLRERGEDVILLARHLLKAAAEKDKKAPPRLPPDVATALRAHHWPGNVRELENEMRRLVLLAPGRDARRSDLSPEIGRPAPTTAGRALFDVRLAFEREHVRDALRRSQGNRTRAAAELGITRQALYDKIRRFGLHAPTTPEA